MEKKYQIFISSTYKDLIEARSKVRDAILSMMHFPVGMEMFNAADEEQWEIIQETIDSSDYYVLILGQRYGSVIESGSDAGISYTEKEFRYAREKKIPVLVFIIDDDVAIKPEFIEKDPESIKKLADFKTEAKKGRTVQWWTNIDELAREVSESLHQQMDRKKRPGWIRGDAFDIEASHAEILSLNKKIRELEQENAELKSQIVKRVPELMAAVVLDQQDDEEVDGKGLKTHGKLLIDSSDNAIKIQLYHNDTGPIDAYFNYALGYLEYRSVRFENEILDKPNFQGNAAVNYTDRETPWTRIIEHKWFEFGKDENGNDLPKTIISREYSSEWKPGDEPYYPVNDAKNGALYAEYKKLAEGEKKIIFGGRLGEYKYYDMDAVVASALEMSKKEPD